MIDVVKNNLFCHLDKWEDPSDLPDKIPSYYYWNFGGEYSFKTDDIYFDEQLLEDEIREYCDIDKGMSLVIDYTVKDGLCTVKIVKAKYTGEE